jgi:hypothetical protein
MQRFLCVSLLLMAVGCSDASKAERLTLNDVPENLMTIAKEKLPGVAFDQAIRKSNGIYEIIGKDANGKVREIELTPEGEIAEIE